MTKEIRETAVMREYIKDTLEEMRKLASTGGFVATQKLNGVTVFVAGDSDITTLLRDLRLVQRSHREGPVGPYSQTDLPAENKDTEVPTKTTQ